MTSECVHYQIVALKKAGLKNNQGMKEVNVCRKAVYNVMKCFNETGRILSEQFRKESLDLH